MSPYGFRGHPQDSHTWLVVARTKQATNMAMKGKYRRDSTSLYSIESRETERKLTEERKKKKALRRKPAKAR
jgi:hypothetical protein